MKKITAVIALGLFLSGCSLSSLTTPGASTEQPEEISGEVSVQDLTDEQLDTALEHDLEIELNRELDALETELGDIDKQLDRY